MFCRPTVLCFVQCITETVHVIKGCKYFLWGPNVGQLWVEASNRVATIYDRCSLSTFQVYSAQDLQFGLHCLYKFCDCSQCHILNNEVPKLPIQQVIGYLSTGVKHKQENTAVTFLTSPAGLIMGGVCLTHVDCHPKKSKNVSEIPVLILRHHPKPHVTYSWGGKWNFHGNIGISNNIELKEFSTNLAPT